MVRCFWGSASVDAAHHLRSREEKVSLACPCLSQLPSLGESLFVNWLCLNCNLMFGAWISSTPSKFVVMPFLHFFLYCSCVSTCPDLLRENTVANSVMLIKQGAPCNLCFETVFWWLKMTESEGSSVSTSEPEAAPSRGRGRRGRGRRGGGRSGGRGGGGSSSRGHHGGGGSRGCSDGFAVDRSASEATSETEETKRVRLQEVQWKCRKGEKRELDSSHSEGEASPDAPSNLMRYVTWIVDKLDSKDVDCLRAHHSQHTLNIGELCAGMATGTIASKTLESKITEIHGLTVACQTVFYSEMVAWKRALCQEVHKSCGGEHAAPALFKSRTAELNGLKEPKVDLWIGAIECDDVSPLTTTPRSILDREGRSGSSFMEMLDVLSSCGMDARPRFIMLECVAALDKLRKAVNEKGTKVATDKLAELGYAGSWNLLNTRDFGLPQSRSRTYGVFVMRSAGFGMHGQEIHMKQVQRVWDFVASCKIDKPDVLAKFLSDAKFAMLADEMSDAKKKEWQEKGGEQKQTQETTCMEKTACCFQRKMENCGLRDEDQSSEGIGAAERQVEPHWAGGWMCNPEVGPAHAKEHQEPCGPGLPGCKHWGLPQLCSFQLHLPPLPSAYQEISVYISRPLLHQLQCDWQPLLAVARTWPRRSRESRSWWTWPKAKSGIGRQRFYFKHSCGHCFGNLGELEVAPNSEQCPAAPKRSSALAE